MIRLLLLLPLSWLAARMLVEWLWFAQFDWQGVLLQRWGLQLLSGGCAAILLLAASRWSRTVLASPVDRSDSLAPVLRGWRYSLLLAVSGAVLLVSGVLIGLLVVEALRHPTTLGQWSFDLSGSRQVLVLLSLAVGLLALRLPWMVWLMRLGWIGLVVIAARAWSVWALAVDIPDTGLTEPLFGGDISFSLARFAAIKLLLELGLLAQLFTLSGTVWGRLIRPPCLSDWECPGFAPHALNGLRRWSGLILTTAACWCWLSRHQLLWTQSGMVAGAGWLQVHLTLPFRSLIALLLLLLAIAVIAGGDDGLRRRAPRLLLVLLVITVLIEQLVTPLTRWLLLRPQELTLQMPYLEQAITSTRRAFQLDRISFRSDDLSSNLTSADLETAASTVDNIRLWDSRPLLETNRQLQQLRVYYRFSNAAVDRYPLLPDRDTAQQVILAARELEQSELPRRSRTWLNRHFVFTHGYGFTLSPVNAARPDGLPPYFISDLGSATRIEGNARLGISRGDVERVVPVNRAALYFGMLPSPYAVAPTLVDEFDYPEGDVNVYTNYSGAAGVPIGFLPQRLAAAAYLMEPRLLTTGSMTSDTRLLLRRDVHQRVKAIAPFLEFRGDPYLVSVPIQEGRAGYEQDQNQYWIVEGFTRSATYPYSAAVGDALSDRYLRNSVKAVVDAFNGSVHFYVSEPEDPLIRGWSALFPDLFEPLSAMPESLRRHLRVPEALFKVQVQQLQTYHVIDPRVLYSGDDVWQLPVETYGDREVPVEPYHITAQLEANSSSEFLLLQPFTPQARPNLTGWLAARNDGDHYGELVLIDFPQDKPIPGPQQVQARINQDPDISKMFGLWDRGGSEVVQGNLLVVPVGSSLLYVEPVYLRASQGGLPTLVRIVVSDGRGIAMADTLSGAIDQLMKKAPAGQRPPEPDNEDVLG